MEIKVLKEAGYEEAKSAILAGEAYLHGMKVLVIANTFGMMEVV
jgi:hypothetical protein